MAGVTKGRTEDAVDHAEIAIGFTRTHFFNLIHQLFFTDFPAHLIAFGVSLELPHRVGDPYGMRAGDAMFKFRPTIERRSNELVINVYVTIHCTRTPNPYRTTPPTVIVLSSFDAPKARIIPFFLKTELGGISLPREKDAFLDMFLNKLVYPVIAGFINQDPAYVEPMPEEIALASPQPAKTTNGFPKNATIISLYDPRALERDVQNDLGANNDEFGLESTRVTRIHKALIARGAEGAKRALAHATAPCMRALHEIDALAPHMREVSSHIRNALALSLATKTPIALTPIVINGPAGSGKSWYAQKVAAALKVPFRKVPMTGVSLSETFIGASPQWKSADMGIVSATLLKEKIANPVIMIDEFDKFHSHEHNKDPFRPFYTLFEKETADSFLDEYLGFPMKADGIIWIVTTNSISDIPGPILSRMNVFEVPEINQTQKFEIAQGIYRSLNAKHHNWFDETLPDETVRAVLAHSLRDTRKLIENAMARSCADLRTKILPKDVIPIREKARGIGF